MSTGSTSVLMSALAGVVRAQLRRAGFRVQAALKQRAHDAGLDELPVRFGGVGELAAIRLR